MVTATSAADAPWTGATAGGLLQLRVTTQPAEYTAEAAAAELTPGAVVVATLPDELVWSGPWAGSLPGNVTLPARAADLVWEAAPTRQRTVGYLVLDDIEMIPALVLGAQMVPALDVVLTLRPVR